MSYKSITCTCLLVLRGVGVSGPCCTAARPACGVLTPQALCQPQGWTMFESPQPAAAPRIWEVGALCRAIADALEARFNPVAVRGEITGFSRASSGHCYGRSRTPTASCAVPCSAGRRACLTFRRAMGNWWKCAGAWGVRGPGDLQFIVESMQRAGQGALFEQFLRLKSPAGRRRPVRPAPQTPLPVQPRGIGLITSLGAAALITMVTARRRAAHPGGAHPCAGGALRRPIHGDRTAADVRIGGKAKPGRRRNNAGGGCDLAGARWWVDGGLVGLQRRATGAHHCAKPGAAGQRVGLRPISPLPTFAPTARAHPTAAAELVAQPREGGWAPSICWPTGGERRAAPDRPAPPALDRPGGCAAAGPPIGPGCARAVAPGPLRSACGTECY